MRRFEVEIEHNYDNKFVGSYNFKSKNKQIIFGSSRDAHVRLLGDEVAGIHAMLEYSEDGWTLLDLCSDSGTWVRKNPVLETPIHHETICNIGGHLLKIKPIEIKSELFKIESRPGADENKIGDLFHQVILRKNDHIIATHLLKENDPFIFLQNREKIVLKAPNDHIWVKSSFADIEIQQRLVRTSRIEDNFKEKIFNLWDPNFKMPAIISTVSLMIIFGLIAFYPQMENSELKQLKPLKNKYTRMIYDAKSTKKHREKTQKLKNKFVSKTTKKTKTSKTVKPVKTNKPPKVVNFSKKFKKSGLSQLIGKIAQRASKTATIVKSQGVKPSNSSRAGRAFSSVSKSKLKNSKVKSNLKSFKLNSVSTIGAGSAAKLKGLDGLASGSVGQANVGIIEEDTDVQGGLAREIIARTIRENLGQIRYCYERQLSANPELYGKLLVKFVIGPNGQVASQQIGTSTMNSAMVEGCILRRIAKWKFPKPDGGTNVRVSYPFLFKSTN